MSQDNSLLVNTRSGPVLGFQDTFPISDRSNAELIAKGEIGQHSPVNKWLGIPYAQAARWKRPTPPESWQEPLACHEFGPYFPQTSSAAVVFYLGKPGIHPRAWREQSEEKGFNLNVFVSEGSKPDEKLPVLVWIYGGSLTKGSACLVIHDPTEWIRREASVGRRFIVVTGNYRVNIFGFLAGSDLASEDEDGLSGNYGAYDCIAYLEWVQDNIAHFGGDPDNVTVFGESAAAIKFDDARVGGLMASNLLLVQKKLFKNVILQSGFPGTIEFQDADVAETHYKTVCTKASIKADTSTERLEALRALSTAEILNLLPQFRDPHMGFAVENSPRAIWPSSSVAKLLKQGKWSPYVKSVMLGVTKDEGSLFVSLLEAYKPDGYDLMCRTFLAVAPRAEVERLYPPEFNFTSGASKLTTGPGAEVLNDWPFQVPGALCAEILSSTTNAKSKERLRVFVYQLNATVNSIEEGRGLGAFHSVDVIFLFNLKEAWESNSSNAKTSELMGKAWVEFAKSGCPDPNWPQYSTEEPFRKVFEADGNSTIEDLARKSETQKARYDFWSQFC